MADDQDNDMAVVPIPASETEAEPCKNIVASRRVRME